jgi:hypothetical protein
MLLAQKRKAHIRNLPVLHRFLSGQKRDDFIVEISGHFFDLPQNLCGYRLKILTNRPFYAFNQIWYRSAQMLCAQFIARLLFNPL